MYERKNEMGRILALYKWNLSHNSQFLLNSYWSLFQLFSLSWFKPFFLKYWFSLRHGRDTDLNSGTTILWLWVKVSIFYLSITWCCIRLGWLIWNVRWQNVSAIQVFFHSQKMGWGFTQSRPELPEWRMVTIFFGWGVQVCFQPLGWNSLQMHLWWIFIPKGAYGNLPTNWPSTVASIIFTCCPIL